jgi:hypothetical protein
MLIPAVENSVSGNAVRPLDIVRTRGGKTVEIGNTDAEGRLILCDALAEADSEHPDLLIGHFLSFPMNLEMCRKPSYSTRRRRFGAQALPP